RARPVGPPERLWRWCRREPALAALALALLGGLAGVATQWWRAESHLKDALPHRHPAEASALSLSQTQRAPRPAIDPEQTARRRAQERFKAAMKTVGGFETIAKDAALRREPRMEGLRAKLHQTALGFYRELQASLEEDVTHEDRTQLAEAYMSVGQIT